MPNYKFFNVFWDMGANDSRRTVDEKWSHKSVYLQVAFQPRSTSQARRQHPRNCGE